MAQVSVVVISHSRKIGEGLVALLSQLAGNDVYLSHAAGLGEQIGTDATFIMDVLKGCPADSDILVLFDLGSALMNTEMALQLLPDHVRQRVHIVDAPLVEGAVAAAVAARVGFTCDRVIASAMEARTIDKMMR